MVQLPDWEGPLDLLLHVVRSHELDILDIPIAFVTEQYLTYLSMMQSLSLDLAAEYLEMAATLAYIKSRMMLPTPPADDDAMQEPEAEEDPRQELIRRLLEYQRYKAAASDLAGRPIFGRDTFAPTTTEPLPEGERPLMELGVFDLLQAFKRVLDRTAAHLVHEVMVERVSVSERIGEIVELLRPGELVAFSKLFDDAGSRLDLVVTFLALLEMTKLHMTRLFQETREGEIFVTVAAKHGGSQPPPAAEGAEAHQAEAEIVDGGEAEIVIGGEAVADRDGASEGPEPSPDSGEALDESAD